MLAMMSLWSLGCGNTAGLGTEPGVGPAPGAAARPSAAAAVRLAAASDLQLVLPKLLDRFQARTGIATSPPVFLASGQLAQQIAQGAPFDIFLAANESFVRDLAAGGLIVPESVHPYARGSLVLAVYHEFGDQIRTLADLAAPVVRKIALANPVTAPYGKAGQQVLERAGLWARLQSKIVLAESVRQALLYAQKGDAEAALVGRAIATVPGIRVIELDPGLYDPIVQALGIVANTPRQADAEAFVQFILGDEGQAILKEFGFKPARTPTDNSPRDADLRARDGTGTK
jgi:molybdate transport system substrate-binding protein